MLKRLAAVAGAGAIAAAGITLAAAPAHAAPAHKAGSVFLHGTTHMAQFWSRTDCDAHARYEVQVVTKASATATLLPAAQRTNAVGPELRFTCYPLRSGMWSYLTAYTSKTGNPVMSADLYVDTTNRAAQIDAGTSIDTQDVWPFAHMISEDAATHSAATCQAQRDYIVKQIQSSTSLRLIGADKTCTLANGRRSYEADYASTSPGGLPYDHVATNASQQQPMLDTLGYKYAGAPTFSRTRAHHLLAWK